MNFIGVDLHKKSITVCVMDEKRKVLARKTLACTQTDEIVEFCRQFRPFKVVVEATASYLWFVELVEPLAEKVVLANPKKLRVIAESTKKTDRLDAQVLTEFLVLDMIPESYQPTPRQRQHRALVRHRQYLQGRITSVRHGPNAGHSSGVPGVDARRATLPDPRLARWGLASCCQLDPSHPALGTREDPGVEPCLIPCGPSWSLSRLPAWPGLRSPLLERPGIASALHA